MKCSSCSNDAIIGKKTCRACLDTAKVRAAENYKKNKLERRCKSCPNKVQDTKGIYCVDCRQKKKDTWNKRKAEGICVTCGKAQKTVGLKCMPCYTSTVATVEINKQERLSNGLCAYCDNPRVNNRLCQDHFLKFTAKTHLGSSKRAAELYELFIQQNATCPYTKIKLDLGKNASIDHRIPKSRGGSTEIDNLQWIYCNVNFMKGDMLEDEFYDLVSLIAKNISVSS